MVSTRNQKKQSHPSSDHQKWQLIYHDQKQMLRKQDSQIDSLIEVCQYLQEHIQLQNHCYSSHVRLLDDTIAQKQDQLLLSESAKLVEIYKANFLLDSKQREALINKRKLEHAWSELDDFKAWFDILSHRCPDDKEVISPNKVYESLKASSGGNIISKEAPKHHFKLEKEVATLKHEYEMLSIKRLSDISALNDEKIFVWNQYKTMENNLKTKNDELAQANEKITSLVSNMEQLQSANVEKDETVATLRDNVTKLEAEVNKKDGDVCRLSKELELLKSKITDGLPLLNHCSNELSSSGLKGRRSSIKKKSAVLEEEATSVQFMATISSLRAKFIELEVEGNQKSEEISRLSEESKLLRLKAPADIPVLKRCANEPSSSRSRGKNNGRNGKTASLEEEASSMQLVATIATLKDKISELEEQSNQKDGEISALSNELKLIKSKSAADTPVLNNSRPSSSRSRGRKKGRDSERASMNVSSQSNQKDGEISALSNELKLIRSKSAADTPVLNNSRPSSSRSRGRKKGRDSESASMKSSSQLVTKQSGSRSKRERDAISFEETPRLFTSQFKIPKLRSQSPRER